MNRAARLAGCALVVCALGGSSREPSPNDSGTPAAAPVKPAPIAVALADAKDEGNVKLTKLTFADFLTKVAKNPKAKYTLVDAWASWCGPCKENFPHLVEMHHKYADKGLAVASLSLDDPKKPKDVAAAEKFLNEKKATFTNVLLDEDAEAGAGFEKLNVSAIPAVFVYDSSGKEVKRFTGDDPNNQFTYDEVEKYVVALLEGKTPPEDAKKPAK